MPSAISLSCTAATTPPTMQASPSTEKAGITACAFLKPSFLPQNRLAKKPAVTGISVTISMLRNIPTASTSTCSPASHSTSSGVTTGASRVEAVVIPTEKATSPLQRYDMILLDTPPGQHPTSIMPTITGFGITMPRYPTPTVSVHAISGMSEYCAQVPISMSHGRAASTFMSCMVSVSPMVSMINPSTADCVVPCTHVNRPGTKYVTTATAMMKYDVCVLSQLAAFVSILNIEY